MCSGQLATVGLPQTETQTPTVSVGTGFVTSVRNNQLPTYAGS